MCEVHCARIEHVDHGSATGRETSVQDHADGRTGPTDRTDARDDFSRRGDARAHQAEASRLACPPELHPGQAPAELVGRRHHSRLESGPPGRSDRPADAARGSGAVGTLSTRLDGAPPPAACAERAMLAAQPRVQVDGRHPRPGVGAVRGVTRMAARVARAALSDPRPTVRARTAYARGDRRANRVEREARTTGVPVQRGERAGRRDRVARELSRGPPWAGSDRQISRPHRAPWRDQHARVPDCTGCGAWRTKWPIIR